MKKIILLTIATICIVTISFSQINKGSVLLGGGISANTGNSQNGTNEDKFNGIFIYPAIGIAVKNNTVIGFRAGYGHSKNSSNNSVYAQKDNSYNAGFFLRKYLLLAKNFYLFGEAGASYGYHKNEQVNGIDARTITKDNSIGLNIYPGIAYTVNKRFHLEVSVNNLAGLGYSKTNREDITIAGASHSEYSNFSLSANASSAAPFTLGFRFVLGK